MFKKIIISFFSLILSCALFAQTTKDLNEMVATADAAYNEINDFIDVVADPGTQKRLRYILEFSNGYFNYFLFQIKEMTKELTDKREIFKERQDFADAFDQLLDNRFLDAERVIKEVNTLYDYRMKWFERAMYVFLKSKTQIFRYHNALSIGLRSDLSDYKKRFTSYVGDLLSFIYQNKELYQENSVFIKKVFLSEGRGGSLEKEEVVSGDIDLLLEFLKGRFVDFQGLAIKYATFRKSETQTIKKQDIVLLMQYQPVKKAENVVDVRDVEVSVTGDNLEDILTFTLNQASKIVDMQVSSDKNIITLSTSDANYQQMEEQSIMLSRVVVQRAYLLFKKEVKPEKEDKNAKKQLEVGLRLKIGFLKK